MMDLSVVWCMCIFSIVGSTFLFTYTFFTFRPLRRTALYAGSFFAQAWNTSLSWPRNHVMTSLWLNDL
jgi:hypothetical protein